MNYPLISEYIEAIKYAEDNFATLTNLRPVLDDDGCPVMSSGNFAVVFKIKDKITGKLYAVKCFLREQEGRDEAYRMISEELEYVNSTYLTPIKYLKRELLVNTSSSTETEFPVLLMDWVEGMTLDKYIRNHLNDQYELSMLAYQFSRLAMWLMPQPFAHGDLKPDNIIVKNDGTLVLVDYDGMYVPAMKGQKARELGSPDYRHPARTIDCFNEHIDDFSLAAIAMQLAAIAQDSGLIENQKDDILLLTEKDHCDLINSSNHKLLHSLLRSPDFEILYALYHLAHANHTLSNVCFRAFQFPKPEKKINGIKLSTKVSDIVLKKGTMDKYGVIYSHDGLQLLKGAKLRQYCIRQGTKVICDEAFSWCESLTSITIPSSVTHIGDLAFEGCYGLSSIILSDSVTHIGDEVFSSCHCLSSITIPRSVTRIGNNAFSSCHSLSIINIPDSVTHIGDRAFLECKKLSTITIPNSVKHIGDEAFSLCESLFSITIPSSVTHIGNYAFSVCKSLTTIIIPRGSRAMFEQMLSNNLHSKLIEQ